MKETYRGACKHCGQVVVMQLDPREYTDADLDTLASQKCSCESARKEYEIQTAIDEAIEDIDKVFPEEEPVRGYIKQSTIMVAHENIAEVTVKINERVKAKISKTTKGKIRFQRVTKDSISREH